MVRNAIYLSGWEYNRLRSEDPTTPATSGLPAEALWNGAGQFWLFETVYCTQESLDGDVSGWTELGWTTGKIFSDLARRGFLKPVRWEALAAESPVLTEELRSAHAELRAQTSDETLLQLLRTGAADELERLKLKLLQPILKHLGCVQNVSPNSVTAWFTPPASDESSPNPVAAALRQSVSEGRLGMKLCSVPGTGVSRIDVQRQSMVEETIQKPMIPALLAGILPQAEYHRALRQTADVYRPINAQLQQQYEHGIQRLERLREVAKSHLWPNLHNEWLPRLEEEPDFLPEFTGLLQDAALSSRFDPYLQDLTEWAIIGASGALGWAAYKSASIVGADPAWTAASVGAITKQALSAVHSRRRDEIKPIALFYQKARRILARR